MSWSLGRLWQKRTARNIVTRRVDLRRRGLRLGADGIRVVVVADVHARADWFPRSQVARLVDAIQAVPDVDIVAMVGDFTGDDPSAISVSADEYRRIDAPVVATLGNHDHWAGPHHATDALTDAGITVMSNCALPLEELVGRAGGTTWITGIDSCWTRSRKDPSGADPDVAFADVPDDAESIVLGHEPHLATMHEHALHLAGHTHCGQIRSPLFGDATARMHMPRFSEPFPCRLYEVPVDQATSRCAPHHRTSADRRWVYTTAGVGFSTIDMRGFCPPEIVVIDC